VQGKRSPNHRQQRARPAGSRKSGGPSLPPRPDRRQNNGAGYAHQNYERYLALAREATSNGDTIEAENFYQHAEHYFRVMKDRTN
jgi:hypothetical protein